MKKLNCSLCRIGFDVKDSLPLIDTKIPIIYCRFLGATSDDTNLKSLLVDETHLSGHYYTYGCSMPRVHSSTSSSSSFSLGLRQEVRKRSNL